MFGTIWAGRIRSEGFRLLLAFRGKDGMPSQEFQNVVQFLRQQAAVAPADVPIEQARAMIDMGGTTFPPPPESRFDALVAGGVRAEWAKAAGASEEGAILYLHGGGYCIGSITSHRGLAAFVSQACGVPSLIIDYRLAPEHPHPAAVEDALAAYRWLLERFDPSVLAIGGDSAGGGLTFSTLVAALDAGLPLPSCAFALSPWADLEGLGESWTTCAESDPLINRENIKLFSERYLAGQDARTPLAAPIYSDLSGLPPILIHVGESEVLLDDSHLLAERAIAAGVDVTLDVWPEMIHVWHFFASMVPESREALDRVGQFVRSHLGC